MIKKEELKYLQDYIKATMDLPEYEELRSIGGDALVFEEVKGLIQNDISDHGADSFLGFEYSKLLGTLDKIQVA